MIRRIQFFLGPVGLRAFIILLGSTGLLSLILNAVNEEWVPAVQTLLVLVFVVGTLIIVGLRLSMEERLRWLAILAPALGALILGVTVLPNLLLPLWGAAAGWVLAGIFLFRRRIPREFQQAIRFFRKGQYVEAVQMMDHLIKTDEENPDYYRFRAEIFRIWGKLDRARKDYQRMAEIAPDMAVAHNGLAEVCLQSGRYAEAHQAALVAYELAPAEWVAAYNLGMIEDRLGKAEPAVKHLEQALNLRVPDARHRLLIYLYLARAYMRLGHEQAANEAVENIRKQRSGLEEWENLLQHEQAAALRMALAADIETAQALAAGTMDVKALV